MKCRLWLIWRIGSKCGSVWYVEMTTATHRAISSFATNRVHTDFSIPNIQCFNCTISVRKCLWTIPEWQCRFIVWGSRRSTIRRSLLLLWEDPTSATQKWMRTSSCSTEQEVLFQWMRITVPIRCEIAQMVNEFVWFHKFGYATTLKTGIIQVNLTWGCINTKFSVWTKNVS